MANYVLHVRGARYLYLKESEFKKNIENNFNYSILMRKGASKWQKKS